MGKVLGYRNTASRKVVCIYCYEHDSYSSHWRPVREPDDRMRCSKCGRYLNKITRF